MSDVNPQTARDLLLPGLWGFKAEHPDIALDLVLDGDNLVVNGINKRTELELSVLFTAAQIQDGISYSKRFRPAVERLIEFLEPLEDLRMKKSPAAKPHVKEPPHEPRAPLRTEAATPPQAHVASAVFAASGSAPAERKHATSGVPMQEIRALLAHLRHHVADPALKGRCDEALAKIDEAQ